MKQVLKEANKVIAAVILVFNVMTFTERYYEISLKSFLLMRRDIDWITRSIYAQKSCSQPIMHVLQH